MRRDLHRHPELSGHEERTARTVVEALSALPLQLSTGIAGHGLIADLEGAKPGPLLAFRADMDALPIAEDSDADYRSAVEGVMHACGHDVHTTIGVGLARSLAASRDRLHGRVRFVFQPAEEAAAPPGEVIGAEAMARVGVLDGVDAILAVHCMPELPVGRWAVPDGTVWATSDIFDIRLKGRQAHGAKPHQGVDAVQMAAAVIQAALALPARLTDPLQPCVLTVGSVQAGTSHNILAGDAKLTGILRTLDEHTRTTAQEALKRLVKQIASAHDGEGTVHFQLGANAVLNHDELTDRVRTTLHDLVGPEGLGERLPQMSAEDFSAFSNRVPGCYFFLGTRNEARGITYPIHSTRFDVDEACIPFAIQHLTNLFERLGRNWSPLEAEHHS